MKKLSIIIAAIVCSLMFSVNAKAQESKDYFIGKWQLLTTGLPDGDAKSVLTLTRGENGKLTGNMAGEGRPADVFTKIDEKEKFITCFFTASGYDVYIYLEKKDDNNITGSLLDMFDCTGTRIVESKK
ncbi:hypothetical protein EOD40_00550 [Flavobacterium sufflavum]|uniref:Lipocalin-like domain-containing protein n=1 Tax=Flavobacterium sufflavum TaxID=1921138 RepID=A0A437L2V7_9FLAO|nr:hypothetical protein [Flavobacterium sufflavum]RVT79635.1 hypothetical protein EOD40_00550 [Flavobacterium sufflavum]